MQAAGQRPHYTFVCKIVKIIDSRDHVFNIHQAGRKPEELRESCGGAQVSVGRELPTTHRVVICAMVITCSVEAAAAVDAAANPLRLPWHSSCLSSSTPPSRFLLPTPSYTPSSCPSTTMTTTARRFIRPVSSTWLVSASSLLVSLPAGGATEVLGRR